MLNCDEFGGVGNGSGIPLMNITELSISFEVPVSLNSAAFCPALLTINAASRTPTLTGEKTTLILQFPIGPSDLLAQSLSAILKSLAASPEIEICSTFNAFCCSLVKMTVYGALSELTS